jgi:hypothetical protein
MEKKNLNEIIATQGALHALVVSSTNYACRWIFQSWSRCRQLSFSEKNAYLEESLQTCIFLSKFYEWNMFK